MRPIIGILLACTPLYAGTTAAPKPQEFVVLLDDQPVSVRFNGAIQRDSLAARTFRAQIHARQAAVTQRLTALKVPVTGSADTFLNALFVSAPMDQVAAILAIPGVSNVALAPRMKRKLDRALDLQKVKQAWNSVGGVTQAGAGVKIAILDSGIDQTHPGLRDDSLRAPAGFPVGNAGFTNSKVIAARSYVSMLSSADVRFSTPDDTTPRDHVGHGTALAMIAAGNTVQGPAASITGVAPKAFLGNYKIFGSPGVNDTTTTAVLVQALEDAYNDGMDIAVLSLGQVAFGAGLDTGCKTSTPLRSWIPATACDVNAIAVEHAALAGMVVVVAAGNDGCSGFNCPTLGTINSPGTAPSAITVGSTTNSHVLFSQVRAGGQTFNGFLGNGPKLNAPLTAPIVDVTKLGDNGEACKNLTAGSLSGSIALVARGTCNLFEKANFVQFAGAVAVIVYDTKSDSIFQPTFLLTGTGIPLQFVGITAGTALKSATTATIDPMLTAFGNSGFDQIAFDSSRGPTIGNAALKPEIAAVGANIYTATQNYDPNGDSYDVSRFNVVNGTSYAAAMVGGAAALVKQAHPGYTAAQIKSALVNTATADVITDPSTGALARTTAVGAGKLDAASAVSANVVLSPSVASFGQIAGKFPAAIPITVTNTGSSSQSISLSVGPRDKDGNASLTVSPSSVSLSPGQSQVVNLSMGGKVPTFGTYEGQVNVTGGSVPLHIPYSYIVTDGKPANVYPMYGDYYFAAVQESPNYIFMRITDQFGAPVANAPVQWSALNSGVVDLQNSNSSTDIYGVAGATIQQSATPGYNVFQGLTTGNFGWQFTQYVNYSPSIPNGILNAATQQAGNLAPGSYATLAGSDFSTVPILPNTICVPNVPCLPISMGDVSVSFDAGGISVPAPLSYMSFNQINLQIPWEMAGQSSASVKVTFHGIPGPVVTLPLDPASPAFFEFTDSTNSQLTAVAQDLKYQLITSKNAAARGKVITLYANGLGPVDNTPVTGALSSSTKLGRTTTLPVVTIGGKTAPVAFSGLTPQTIGLYQINVTVPPDAPVGVQKMTVSIGGVTSRESQLPVQ
jgi:minor extracellular serine protease Vpr